MSNPAAAQTDWKGQYDTLMEQLGMGIESDEKARKLPRFTFKPPERILLVHVGGMVGHIRDISAGGLSFHIEVPFRLGRQIDVTIDQTIHCTVEVVNISQTESADSHSHGLYRIGTKFLTDDDGYRCTVISLKIASQIPHF